MEQGETNSEVNSGDIQKELDEIHRRFKNLMLGPQDVVTDKQLVAELLEVFIKLIPQQMNILEMQEDKLLEQKEQLLSLGEDSELFFAAAMVQNMSDKMNCNDSMLARNQAVIERFKLNE